MKKSICTALSASNEGKKLYNFRKMRITRFPSAVSEKSEWGLIEFSEDEHSNINVAVSLKESAQKAYFELLDIYLK